jgi:hypothetical protein
VNFEGLCRIHSTPPSSIIFTWEGILEIGQSACTTKSSGTNRVNELSGLVPNHLSIMLCVETLSVSS